MIIFSLKNKIDMSCATCEHLKSGVTRKGMKPRCDKEVMKFKERSKIDWNASDLQNNSCGQWEDFRKEKD